MKSGQSSLIFRKGLDCRADVAGALLEDYHSAVVERVKAADYRYESGRLTVHLAREFGFCYGVDRAVDYAYQTRHRFPDRRVYLTGEIIHNPYVNQKLRASGIRFLTDHGEHHERLGPGDVVIIPAFGIPVADLAALERRGVTLVDTTCGSVLNVWKNVLRYAQDAYTALIHGKVHHEETQATASQTLRHTTGRYLIVLDREEAAVVCDYIRAGRDSRTFLARFANAASPGFDPDRDLLRIGLANQTTMLMSESLAIGEMFRQAMVARWGVEGLADHFRAFDTICTATQDRQDAVVTLLDQQHIDLMVVIGGYNSSNTRNLARICADRVPCYHVAGVECLVSATEVRHRRVDAAKGSTDEVVTRDWLPSGDPVAIGLTAGASTPNNIIGRVIESLDTFVNGPRSSVVSVEQ